ncbi:MAG: hypothetical protein ACMG6S_18815 [Byssovorax sp.]
MKLSILRLGLVLTLGACSSPRPLEPFDAGTIVNCNRDKGPVDGGADVDAGTKECKPGDICIMSAGTAWVCAHNVIVACNSEKGVVPGGADRAAGTFLCLPGYHCFNPTDGTGFQCYPPASL